MSAPPPRPDLRRKALPLFGVALGMLGMAYASVPFYTWFCQVTGYAGTPRLAAGGATEVLDRTVTVRFDASAARDMPWSFRPEVTHMTLRVGETGLAFYVAHNPTDRPVTGTAAYNVSPFSMGEHFVKVQCFCFTEQTLAPGETARMPVSFYVDPAMARDPETERVHSVTLSYTFYQTEPAEQAVLD